MIEFDEKLTKKRVKKIIKHNNTLVIKLGVKTRALWIAAEIIQEKIEPNKTAEQVYEMLKFMGKEKLKQDKPEKAQYVK